MEVTPSSVQRLRRALHAQAKAEYGFRFYALYEKMDRENILAHAYARCRANKAAPGVDRQDFADVEAYGRERWVAELALALREADFPPEQYAYRPGRSAQQAVVEVEETLFRSHPGVVDADLSDRICFGW
jgi:RNA-directed DNA polymerase